MITWIFMTGLILSVIWMFAVILMEKKKRTPWLVAGGIVAIVLFLYTQQWKLFLWGIAAGVAGGCGMAGKQLDKLRKFEAENGILHTILIFVIFCVLLFMFMALSAPGLIVE